MKLSELSKESLVSYYYENKDYLIPFVILLSSALLFLLFIVPQLLAFPSKKSERDVEITKLKKIEEARDILENANTLKLDRDVKIASQALPSDKNFELVLSAITVAANLSNTQVNKYLFVEDTIDSSASEPELPKMNFEISILGDVRQSVKYMDELYKTYPISDITEIDHKEGATKLKVSFYYNPLTEIKSEDGVLVRNFSQKENEALRQISGWNDVMNDSIFQFPDTATESAEGSTSPFGP